MSSFERTQQRRLRRAQAKQESKAKLRRLRKSFVVRTIPPPPPEFKEVFESGGWEKAELLYGARTDLIRKWVIMTGAKCRRPKSK